ncbi:MAG: hypothetical protein J5958_01610 [Clostridia bacterium]|nr:hypothetical protein [Clostridia bacterium]MBR5043726.1 hypothetical protein [Clostridia bacterium]
MKRTLSVLLSFVLLLLPCLTLLSACGQSEKNAYTITFSVNGEKTVVEVPKGEVPKYAGETSWETSEHFYKITGWDKEFAPATSDTTYTATVGEYGLTLYDVIFILGGSKLVTVQTHEGEIPTPPEGYETDDTKADKFGTFRTWDKVLTAPTAENTQNGTVKMTYKAIYTYEPKYLASILPAKDGAKGIITMTYDDGNYNTAVWVNQKNKQYGLNGSCMMVPNWSGNNPDFTINGGSVSAWKALFAEGTLEPQNHSMTHERIMPDENWGASEQKWKNYEQNWLQEIYDEELVQSKALIERTFPEFDDICFAPSNNTLSTKSYKSDGNGNRVKENGNYVLLNDGGATKVAQDTFYAIRKGNRDVQSLDPAYDGNPGGWYNLCIRAFKDWSGDEKVTQGKKWIDDTVKDGNWLIVMCHGITATGGDIKQSLAEQFFAYASEFIKGEKKGQLWAATFSEATKYIRERQCTTVSERYEKGDRVLYVDMTINRTAKDGKILTQSIFNYPLTVEVRVPDGWTLLSYSSGGKTATATVYTRDGGSYAMINLVPGADGETVTTAVNRVK